MATRRPVTFKGTRTVDGTLERFEKLMDPQRWQEHYPALWPTSRLIDGDLPPDRDTDPRLQPIRDQFQDALFFEEVAVPFLARYRNVLQTTLVKRPDRIEFSYRQHECLSGKFLDVPSYGSIDVDHGAAVCRQLDDGKVEISISKTVRFTQPEEMLELVDVISGVAVKMVMEMLLAGVGLSSNPGDEDA